MVEPITTIITGLKTAIDTAISVKKLIKNEDLKDRISNLINMIIGLQQHILSIQSDHQKLLQEKDRTSKELMKLKAWNKEKMNYKLTETCPGVFVYSYQQSNKNTDPQHWLCQKCYNDEKKSILQFIPNYVYGDFYICHECGAKLPSRTEK